MKTILVTGGAGFIGSNFVDYFLEKYPDYSLVNLDKLTYAGVEIPRKNPNYFFEKCDIADAESVFQKYKIDAIIHFAAESHVDNSIASPEDFIQTNMVGTFRLLEAARKHNVQRFHHISTDEVYGSLGKAGYFTESTPYAPNSPYSASKAGSDMLVRSYHHTYGLNTVISNCSNNYGPRQHAEKLIPTIIRKALADQQIPIYGDGQNVRDWLYVDDHCRAIDAVFHKGKSGETYLIGGNNERNNLELARKICDLLGKPQRLIEFVKDRPGHDRRYAIDCKKIMAELDWKPLENFESGLEKTIAWYQTQ